MLIINADEYDLNHVNIPVNRLDSVPLPAHAERAKCECALKKFLKSINGIGNRILDLRRNPDMATMQRLMRLILYPEFFSIGHTGIA
jgi:hypothetical protein